MLNHMLSEKHRATLPSLIQLIYNEYLDNIDETIVEDQSIFV